MANTLQLSAAGGDLIALTESSALFSDIGKLGAQWKQLAIAIANAGHQPLTDGPALVQWLLTNLNTPAVQAIFTAVGAGPLLASLIAADAKLNAILPNGAALLAPLNTFAAPTTAPSGVPGDWQSAKAPGLVKIAPAALTVAPGAGADMSVSFALSADAAIGVEADAQWPYASDAMGAGYLMLAAAGSFTANGTFRLPFSYGSLGVSAGAGVDPDILFFFRPPDPTRVFAAAVADVLPVLPDPFDPAAVWQAFALHDLAGMILACDGSATANVDLTIGDKASWPGVLAADATASVTVALTRKAAFELSLRSTGSAALGTMALIVRLTRNLSAETDWGLSAGIDIDASQILGQVQPILTNALTRVGGIIGDITPYLTPGTWLQGEATTALERAVTGWIGNATVSAAVTQDIALLTGTATSDVGGLTDALTKAVAAAIDSVGGAVATDAAGAANTAFAALAPAFPAIVPLQASVVADLTALITSYQTALTTFAQNLLAGSGLPAIEAALGTVGARVSAAATQLDQAVGGISAVITTYAARAQQIVAAAKTAAMAKISLRVSYESAHSDATGYELTGRFTAMAGDAGDLYRALAFGQLAGIQKAFETPAPGFTLDAATSAITRLSGTSSTLGYDFVLLGLEVSGQAVLASNAQAVVSATGDVAITGQASDTVGDKSAAASRSLAFVTTYDFVAAAKLLSASRATIKLGLSATIADRNLTRGDVSAFLGSLQSHGLISGDRVSRANAVFDRWATTRGTASPFGGTVAVTMNLAGSGQSAVQTAGQAIGNANVASAEGQAQFRRAMTAMMATDSDLAQSLHGVASMIQYNLDLTALRSQYPDDLDFLYHVSINPGSNAWMNALRGGGPKAPPVSSQLAYLLDAMTAAQSYLALLAAVAKADALDIAQLGAGQAAAVQQADAAIAKSAGPWLTWGGSLLFSMDARIAPRTVAFFRVLAGLAQGTDAPSPGTFDRMFTLLMTDTTIKATATV